MTASHRGSASPRAPWGAAELAALLLAAVAWEAAGRGLGSALLPPLSSVLTAFARLTARGELLGALGPSLLSLAAGYSLAAGGGLAVGALMGRSRLAEHALDMYVNALVAAPSLIFVPILFSMFGPGRRTQVAVIVLYAFPVIAASTATAVRGVDARLVHMARAFGASHAHVLGKVVLPAALPLAMVGLRVGMARAVKGMISGEMLVALTGLGAVLRTHGSRFDSAGVLAVLLVVVAVALVTTALVQWVDRRVNAWARAEGT
jgi:NitT/TauT family transport system permease protein